MKKLISALLLAAAAIPAFAQTSADPRHEVTLYGKGGISTLLYKFNDAVPADVKHNNAFGGIGLQYVWFFNQSWGLQTGIEADWYRSRVAIKSGFSSSAPFMMGGDQYRFVSAFSNYNERQRATYLGIPIMVQYQTLGKHRFYAAAGVRPSVCLGSKYSAHGQMQNSIYVHPEYSYDEQDPEAFTGKYYVNPTGSAKTRFALMGALEAGMKWRLSSHLRLYTGLYADLAVNNVCRKTDALVSYVPKADPTAAVGQPAKADIASVMRAPQRKNGVRPFGAGIKIGLTFAWPAKKAEPMVVQEVPVRRVFSFTPEFLSVAPERVKTRHEGGSAWVQFEVNKAVVDPDFGINAAELAKIESTLRAVADNEDATLQGLYVKGYASPDGPYDKNEALAQRRTQAILQYVDSIYKVPSLALSYASVPENWEDLRNFVASSDLAARTEILQIIDSDLDPDAKDAEIKKQFPDTYKVLLENVYPRLRKTDYNIAYTVRNYLNPADIERVLVTNPKNLSLNELYVLAESYPQGSEQFCNVYLKAVELFPNDPVSNLNAANIALMRHDAIAAERYLQKAQRGPERDSLFDALRLLKEIQAENY